VNTGIGVHLLLFGSLLALVSGDPSQCQEGSSKSPTEVTVSDLGLHPQKFDGYLVRVQAWLVSGWEGDRFLSDPKPQNMPDGSPAYVWFYCSPKHEQQINNPIGYRVSVYGWFTGYFHFVPEPHIVNGAFNPGNLQFEATEVSIPQQQPLTLAEAIRKGDLEKVRKILHSAAELNVRDEYQSLPLFEAIRSGRADIAQELLAGGADPKLTESDGSTALMAAARHGGLSIAEALLEHGVSVNATNTDGETALIVAPQKGSDGMMVQLLLDAGAGPNAKTAKGMTALIAAAMVGDGVAAQKLLKAGADPTGKDSYGNTAESESCDRGEKGHFRVCELVREALRKK
jgi:Ankyrin repeats (3 copies)